MPHSGRHEQAGVLLSRRITATELSESFVVLNGPPASARSNVMPLFAGTFLLATLALAGMVLSVGKALPVREIAFEHRCLLSKAERARLPHDMNYIAL
jgi:hypothetical protein